MTDISSGTNPACGKRKEEEEEEEEATMYCSKL
jgi:hypothetical protein